MGITTIGSEILVSTGLGDNGYQPVVVKLAGGGFVVAWTDYSNTAPDTSQSAVRAQVFAAGGAPVGSQILVNTTTTGVQGAPQVAALSNGGFVVAWQDGGATGGDTSAYAVRAQVFAADGSGSGGEILVNTTTQGSQSGPQIATLANGGFVIVWEDNSATGGDTSSAAVRGQVFAADGAPVGTEILVNTTTADMQNFQDVTALANGGFVVSWRDLSATGGDTSGGAVRAQVFAADGTRVGGEILANTATANTQDTPEITALTGGGFLIVWEDKSLTAPDTSGNAVRAQVFAADGTRVGSEILVNTATANDQYLGGFTALSNGGFVITWQDYSQGVGGATGDADSYAVKAQVFDANGTKVGTEILVNTTTGSGQISPDVAVLPDGGFVIAWTDQSHTGGDTSDAAVRAQAFAADGARVGTEFLVNTTTANFQGSPQLAALAEGFVVTWTHAPDEESTGAVRAQVFSSSSPNAAPAGADAARSVEYGVTKVLSASDFGFSDTNGNTLAAVKITTLPGSGVLKNDGVAVTTGQLVSAADILAGKLVFVPAGSGAASFTFQVQDNGGTADGGIDLDPTPNTLTLNIAAPPPEPAPEPPPTPTVDGVPVTTTATTGGDGVTRQTVTVPVVTAGRTESVGGANVADIPLVTVGGSAPPVLSAQVPVGYGLTVSGPSGPRTAGSSADDLIGAIQSHTPTGSADRATLTDAGSGFLGSLTASVPLLVQTITPIGDGSGRAPLVINGTAAATDPLTALVIDTRNLPSGSTLQLDNVDFAAVIGPVTITGGAGSQTVYGDGASQNIFLGAGDDELHGGAGADTVASAGGNDRLFGDEGADSVSGGIGDDYLHGNAGADTVSGGEGDDLAHGGKDADRMSGDAGNDRVFGDLGDDWLHGNAGQDTVDGGLGNDTVHGGQDADQVTGGEGNDAVLGDAGDDAVQGAAGADTLNGGLGNDTVHGGQGDDRVWGEAGDDWLSGDRGDDTLTGGAGADVFHSFGEAGIDRIVDFSSAEGDRVQLDPGTTYSVAQVGADTIVSLGGGGQLVLAGVQLATLGDGWLFIA